MRYSGRILNTVVGCCEPEVWPRRAPPSVLAIDTLGSKRKALPRMEFSALTPKDRKRAEFCPEIGKGNGGHGRQSPVRSLRPVGFEPNGATAPGGLRAWVRDQDLYVSNGKEHLQRGSGQTVLNADRLKSQEFGPQP